METEMRAMWTSITRMAQRMEKMEQRLDEVLMLLRSSQSQSPPSAPVDDMLLSPCSTVTELEEFDRSLGQQERRGKNATFPDNSWRFDQRYCHPSHATASGNY
ncbi:hypothetical protein R3I94_012754 [Phoxinus phoxinus]